jgi:hypothetical protein
VAVTQGPVKLREGGQIASLAAVASERDGVVTDVGPAEGGCGGVWGNAGGVRRHRPASGAALPQAGDCAAAPALAPWRNRPLNDQGPALDPPGPRGAPAAENGP